MMPSFATISTFLFFRKVHVCKEHLYLITIHSQNTECHSSGIFEDQKQRIISYSLGAFTYDNELHPA